MPIRNFFIFCFSFIIFIFVISGCASVDVSKTIGLNEKFLPTQKEKVQIVERENSIPQNYQIIGKVTVACNTGVSKANALSKMQEVASQNGADGVIDFHKGPGCAWRYDAGITYNGLMVKWLEPDQPLKPLDKPFMISRLPVMNPQSPNKPIQLESVSGYTIPLLDFPWVNELTFKGYYILPECTYPVDPFTGNSICRNVQLILNPQVISDSTSFSPVMLVSDFFTSGYIAQQTAPAIVHIPNFKMGLAGAVIEIGKEYEMMLDVQLIDPRSGQLLLRKQGVGLDYKSWWMNLIESGEELAIGKAIKNALKDLPKVN